MYISQQFQKSAFTCIYIYIIYAIYIYWCVCVKVILYILYSVYHAGTKTPHLLTSSHIAHVFFQINRPNYADIFSINHFLSQKKRHGTTLKQHLGAIRRFSLTHRRVPTPETSLASEKLHILRCQRCNHQIGTEETDRFKVLNVTSAEVVE